MPSQPLTGVYGGSLGRCRAWQLSICVFGTLLLGHALCPSIGWGQTAITSSGLNTLVPPNCTTCDITGGTQKGSNLFHSFEQFSVGANGTANFLNDASLTGITNILGRVTGPDVSSINGKIQTTNFGTANLFLINPAGWMFGSGASINVGGSFHVSTANYIRLSDGVQSVQFNASGVGDTLLTTWPPVAFGFLGPTVAPISVSLEGGVLGVREGKTLSLVGGDVSITGSTLQAPSGRIQIAGVASAGAVTIPNLDVSSFSSLGQVTISADSIIGTPSVLDTTAIPILDPVSGNVIRGGAGGEIIIRGGSLVVSGGSTLQTGGFGDVNGATPKIDIGVTDSITLDSSTLDVSGRQTFGPDFNFTGGGAGGTVVLHGGSLTSNGSVIFAVTNGSSDGATLGIDIGVTNDVTIGSGSFLLAGTQGLGNSGGIRISAGSLQLREFASINTITVSAGRAGDIGIEARSVALTDGAIVSTSTSGGGAGGDVSVSASSAGSFVMSGGSSITSDASGGGAGGKILLSSPASMTLDSGAFVTSLSFDVSTGGDLFVTSGDLSLTGGAFLRSASGGAPGGNILVTATGAAVISGEGSGIFSGGAGVDGALAGNISLAARELTVTAGGLIQNGQLGDVAGSIFITATDTIVISKGGKILSQTFVNDVGDVTISAPSASLVMDAGLIQTSTVQQGNAGDINVDVATLNLMNGAQIVTSSATDATGRGGDLNIKAANSVSISGISPGDPVSGNDPSSGLFSTASVSLEATAKGGGTIFVKTPLLTISDGGKISAFTPGAGLAGSISLNAGTLSVTGGSQVVTSTTSSGDAGSITVVGTQVDVLSGGRVISESGGLLGGVPTVGGGDSGSVSITATSGINVSGPGSAVSTTTFGDGAGGSVTLTAAQVNIQSGGQVESQSGGTLGGVLTVGMGDAGTVTINATGANTLTISGSGSTVSTSTLGDGKGGDVILTSAGEVRILDGGSVTADSLGGDGFTGTINVTAGNSILMNNGTISTRAVTSDGGDIKLTAPNIVQLEGSQITTSVESGKGGGGNIFIDPQFVLVNNSSIIANAFGGPGGNITIIANNFLASATSIIEASSALSTPGVIEIRSPENNVENSISQLPAAFIDASALLRGLCTARRAGAASSFAVAGRGGVPVDADGYLPAFSTDLAVATAGRTGEPPLAFALLLTNTLDCAR